MPAPNSLKHQHPYALIIIDMINNFDFPGGDQLLEHTKNIIKPLKDLKKKAKEEGIPVIYVNDHYYMWQANYKKIIEFCKNGQNEDILDEITPDEDDYFLIKPKHSAFYETALNTLLHQLEAKNVILTGIAGNICVLFSADEAYMREYNIFVPADCIASNTKKENDFALKMITDVLEADITESSKLTFK